jgi:hypothetical protein
VAKLLVFENAGFLGTNREYYSNDPDLTLNGLEKEFGSAIVLSGSWTLYPDPNYQGTSISLTAQGGPDTDGAFKDYADWGGAGKFTVRSIQYS